MTTHRDRPVVVGVDGTAAALEAARWAAKLARRDHLPLRLVHTYDLPLGLPTGVSEEESMLDALRAEGRRVLAQVREAVAEVDPGLPAETVLVAAQTVPAMLREAETS